MSGLTLKIFNPLWIAGLSVFLSMGGCRGSASLDSSAGKLPPIRISATELADFNYSAYWPFNENTGITTADLFGSNAGTLNGPQWTAGKSGSALNFSGSNHVNFGTGFDLAATSPFTISVLIKRGTASGRQVIFSKAESNNARRGFQLALENSDKLRFELTNTRNSNQLAMQTVRKITTVDQWYFIVVTYDGSRSPTGVKIYINGENQSLETVTNNLTGTTTSTAQMWAGGRFGGADYFNGTIDELGVASRVLTASEVFQLYDYYNSFGTNVSYWPLDENTGTVAHDLIAQKDGTLSGPVWTQGNRASALRFDGVNDYVNLGDNLAFERDKPFAFSLWLKRDTRADGQAILSRMRTNGTHRGFMFWFNLNGKLSLILRNSWGATEADKNLIMVETVNSFQSTSKWYFVAVNYDGSSNASGTKIFVDGVEQPVDVIYNNLTGTIVQAVNGSIGSRNGQMNFFSGIIDDVALFDRKLTPTEITEAFEEFNPNASKAALWRLDENQNTTAADSVGLNHGTLAGPSWAPGKSGSGLSFSAGSYVNIPTNLNFEYEDKFSLSAWAARNQLGTVQTILSKMSLVPTAQGWSLEFGADDKLYFRLQYDPVNAVVVRSVNTITDANIFHYYTATYAGSSTAAGVKLYANGQPIATETVVDSLTETTYTSAPANIGAKSNGAQSFTGILDEVQIDSRTLTPAEALARFNSYLPQNITVVSTSIAPGAQNIAPDSPVQIQFSDLIFAASVSSASVYLTPAATATLATSGNTVTLTPTSPLASLTNYTFTVTTGLTSIYGRPLAQSFTLQFRTGGAPVLEKVRELDIQSSVSLSPFGSLVNKILLSVWTASFGAELYMTDGSYFGTVMLRDIFQGASGSAPEGFTALGTTTYFSADNPIYGRELWKTDGTLFGTKLVRDIRPGSASSNPKELTVSGGILYFSADDGSGRQLWRSDGTVGGTYRVNSMSPGATPAVEKETIQPADLAVGDMENLSLEVSSINPGGTMSQFGDFVIFGAVSQGKQGETDWLSDAGAAYIYKRDLSGNWSILSAKLSPNDLLGNSRFGVGVAVWENYAFVSAPGFVCCSSFTQGAVYIFKYVNDTWTQVQKIEQPTAVPDGYFGGAISVQNGFLAVGYTKDTLTHTSQGSVYMYKLDSNGAWNFSERLLSAEPSNERTFGYSVALSPDGKKLIIGASKTQISTPGADANGSVDIFEYAGNTWNNRRARLAPADNSPRPGFGFAVSIDNNQALVGKLSLTSVGGAYVYERDSAADGAGNWQPKATLLPSEPLTVADIYTGVRIYNNLAYTAAPKFPGSGQMGKGYLFRKRDGQWNSYQEIQPADNQHNTSFGRGVFAQNELIVAWLKDNKGALTVFGISSDVPSRPVDTKYLTDLGGTLFFVGYEAGTGYELYKTDPVSDKSTLLKDIYAGSISSYPAGLTASGTRLFFSASDGVNGNELWKTDGTSEGTVLAKDIFFGSGSSLPEKITAHGNTVYFSAADDENGKELWTSDGTEAGTSMIKNLTAHSLSSDLKHFQSAGSKVFFVKGNLADGDELWATDGTNVGTQLVKKILPGNIQYLVSHGSKVYFSANNGTDGAELWTSDGTGTGTLMLQNLRPGAASSNPSHLRNFGGFIYFQVYDPFNTFPKALWRLDAR